MSENNHNVAIGAFVVGALLIAITTIIFALGSGFGVQRSRVVMVFDGSVKGLTIGAPVALRGVQIGQVTDIELILDQDHVELIMMVEAELRGENIRRRGESTEELTDELISRGLRAQLNSQSLLTGLLYVQLDFHPETPINLAEIDSPYVQIPTIPTGLERLQREVQEIDIAKIASDLESAVAGLRDFAGSERLQALPAELSTALSSITGLSEDLRAQIASSGPRLDKALDGATRTLNVAEVELGQISSQLKADLQVLEGAIKSFDSAMADVEGLVGPDSATTFELNRALREVSSAARALQTLARTLEAQPEALIRGKSGERP